MNTKSKLKAISIGIAAIFIMVSLLAAVSVSAGNSPDLRIQDFQEELVDGQVIVLYRVTNSGDAMAGSSDAGVDVNGYRTDTEKVTRLGPGASYDGTFTLDCTPGATLDVSVCADVYGVVAESNESNNCVDNILVCPIADIEVNKTVRDPDTGDWVSSIAVSRGDWVRFNSTIHNDGTCDLTNIQVWDRLPWGLTYQGVGPGTPTPWVIEHTWGTDLIWTIPGPLELGETLEFLINASADQNGFWTNTQEAHAWSECRQTIVTDIDDATVSVIKPPEIAVEKVADPNASAACTNVTFTITVTNTGGWELDPVTVVDTLPEGMGYAASIPLGEVDVVGNTITWNVGALAPGANTVITLVAHIDAGPSGWTLWNRADVTGTHQRGTVTDWDRDWIRRA